MYLHTLYSMGDWPLDKKKRSAIPTCHHGRSEVTRGLLLWNQSISDDDDAIGDDDGDGDVEGEADADADGQKWDDACNKESRSKDMMMVTRT